MSYDSKTYFFVEVYYRGTTLKNIQGFIPKDSLKINKTDPVYSPKESEFECHIYKQDGFVRTVYGPLEVYQQFLNQIERGHISDYD